MDAKSIAILRKTLQDNHCSLTRTRQLVAELLWAKEPQAMPELIAATQGAIDRATLYRTLILFERLGLVRRVYIGWKYKVELSDVLTHHHHHISCLACGKVTAITEDAAIERLIQALSQRYGFSQPSHQLEMSGYCPMCTRQRDAGGANA